MTTVSSSVVAVMDAYAGSGEFIDVLSGPRWEVLAEPVRRAVRGAGPAPVVDVGAGTGLGTRVLADACPGVPILAVEPSPVLRAVLLARVAADSHLRECVTVGAGDALPWRGDLRPGAHETELGRAE